MSLANWFPSDASKVSSGVPAFREFLRTTKLSKLLPTTKLSKAAFLFHLKESVLVTGLGTKLHQKCQVVG